MLIESQQCFIGLEKIDNEIHLLSDKAEINAQCTSETVGEYSNQVIYDGDWKTGKYSYFVNLIGRSIKTTDTLFQIVDLPELNKNIERTIKNESIAVGDVNNDLLLDIFCNGRLYINNGNFDFDEGIELISTDSIAEFINAFSDVNNDYATDLVLLSEFESYVFINEGQNFKQNQLQFNFSTMPQAYCCDDFNNDDYSDLAVAFEKKIEFYYNNKDISFGKGKKCNYCIEFEEPIIDFEYCDIDSDGIEDIVICFENKVEIFKGFGNMQFLSSNLQYYSEGFDIRHLNCQDINNDGKLEVILSGYISDIAKEEFNPLVLTINTFGELEPLFYSIDNPTDECEDVILGDIDNNGKTDMLLLSSCSCRNANLYIKDYFGRFVHIGFESGLYPFNLGSSGIFADMNNDGNIDLLTWYENIVVLLENTGDYSRNYVDLLSYSQTDDVIELFSKKHVLHHDLSTYQGRYNQVYNRAHFGLGGMSIDSICYNSSIAKTDRKLLNDIFDVAIFEDKEFKKYLAHNIKPNPITDKAILTVYAEEPSVCNIFITDLSGKEIANIYNGQLVIGANKFQIYRTDFGRQIATGTYYYFVSTPKKTYSGKIIISE